MTSPRGVSKSPYCFFKIEISRHAGVLTFAGSASFCDSVILGPVDVLAALGFVEIGPRETEGFEGRTGSISFLAAGALNSAFGRSATVAAVRVSVIAPSTKRRIAPSFRKRTSRFAGWTLTSTSCGSISRKRKAGG